MPHPHQADLAALIAALIGDGVEFIVVGGGAAVLHGAPITTRDLDIVPRQTAENADRLMGVLARLGVYINDLTDRRLTPTSADLLGGGQLNLITELGPIDVLCRLHDGRDFESLLSHTELMTDGEVTIRVLDLPTLIAVKAEAGRARDRIAVPILLALLEEREPG